MSRTFARWCSTLVPVIAVLVCSVLADSSIVTGQLASAHEYRIKAEFLYNFAKFVDWPADTFSDPKQPMCICVYGHDPFGHALEDALLGKMIGERPVVLGRATRFDGLSGCQMIFVSASEHASISEPVGRLQGHAILLVGESDGFAASGGAIQFVVEDNRVRFVINPAAADRAGLKLSARLLAVSKIVRDFEPAGRGERAEMKQKRGQSIRQKITRLVLLSCGVAALVACSVFAVYDVTTARNSLARDLATVAEITGSNSTAAIAFDDPQTAREILESLDVQPHIVEACIYTTDGRVFAKYSRSGSDPDFTPPPVSPDGVRKIPGFMEVFRQIRLKEDVVGTIYLKSDLDELNARMIQFAWTIVGVVLLSFVVLYFAAGRLQRLISDPILELARTAFAVSTGKDYSLRAAKQSDDEIGFLFDRFNEMLGQVQASNTALQQAREGLELRVEERTRELKAEVMERIQAQRSLEERTVFLNSLIENSPGRDCGDQHG